MGSRAAEEEWQGTGRVDVPSVGNDDVVEGCVTFAEAGEADFDNHCLRALLSSCGVVRSKRAGGSDQSTISLLCSGETREEGKQALCNR